MPPLRCTTKPCAYATDIIPPYLDRVLGRVRALPGVNAAAGVNGVPLADTNPADFGPVPARYRNVFPLSVTPGYFATMGIPILRGRDFNAGDRMGSAKKLIVNQAFVDRHFPGEMVTGRTIPLVRCGKGFMGNPQDGCTIVAVVGDVRGQSLALAPQPATYVDIAQDPSLGYSFVVRSTLPAASLLAALRHLLRSLPPVPDGGLPYVFPARPLGATVAASIATPRLRSWLAELFAALALALAAVGVYGVQSHAVSRRRHEIGVRMALGASRGDLRRLVLADALRWTLLGTALGLPVALVGGHALAHWLYRVPFWDPAATVGAPLLLAAVAVLAAWWPMRQAAAVDPNEVLRAE